MEEAICINCGSSFIKSPRHKNQSYCRKEDCRRARKSDWQRKKMRTDSEYRAGQRLSHKKWTSANPGYWKQYRSNNPVKAQRNRLLQQARNSLRRIARQDEQGAVIAKMDASESNKPCVFKAFGQYWLVPLIAKMDAFKANIVVIQAG
jgi:hypothetical protein